MRVVAQQIYQFGHNAWVHPYVGAGVVVLRETSRLEFDQPPFAIPGLPAASVRTRGDRDAREAGRVGGSEGLHLAARVRPRRHPPLALDHVA